VAVVAPHLSVAYLDFGDGNYLYIARRMTEGVVLYRDILAPQPPCHLLVGSLLVRLSRLLGHSTEAELYTVRLFSLLLHLATMVVIWAIARRLFRRESTAIWAAGLYMVIPVGFWWTLSYESEPLELFFLLLSFLLVIRWDNRSLAGAGLLAALGMATNMTAVPYVGWTALFLLWHDRRRAIWYLTPAVVLSLAVVGLGEWLSGGHYLENVFFNQVGTFPHPDLMGGLPPDAPFRSLRIILGYALMKVAGQGSKILALEGVFISAAVAGILIYLSRESVRSSHFSGQEDEPDPLKWGLHTSHTDPLKWELRTADAAAPSYHRSFVGWYAFWSFMAIGFVAKGATEDYIFTIGEPFVCLFAAYAIYSLGDRLFGDARVGQVGNLPSIFGFRIPRLLPTTVGLLGLVVLFARPVLWINEVVRQQRAYELDAANVKKVRVLIEQHSKPGDAILAAPYYAFIASRNLAEEHSELFIWHIKYLLEQGVERTEGPATRKVEAIAAALRKKAIPVIVIDLNRGDRTPRQIFSIPSVREAIGQNYRPLLPEPIPTLNASINVMIPR
jgi:hypothetical protein